ncbi:MAG: hypothetical protein WBV82_00500 [Myxococcaceae bacterium]
MRRDPEMTALGLGVMAGMRSMSAPAWVAHYFATRRSRARRTPVPLLTKKGVRRAFTAMAGGELVADKLPWTPARIKAVPLTGRALSGAIAGAALAETEPRSRWRMAALGAAGAVASSFGIYALRQHAVKSWRVPPVAAGLLEDAAVGALGARLLARA